MFEESPLWMLYESLANFI